VIVVAIKNRCDRVRLCGGAIFLTCFAERIQSFIGKDGLGSTAALVAA
jgi:hypothetical protein